MTPKSAEKPTQRLKKGKQPADALPGDDGPPQVGAAAESEPRFLNRELSALDYNARLLACAEDEWRPALEQARFLAIVSRNLDEFFQIRVSGVREQIDAGVSASSPDGLTPREQLSVIQSRAQELVARQMKIFERDVKPRLHAGGVRITDWDDLKAVPAAGAPAGLRGA